jgi:DHA1 family bicyclomycin/chloramphenicol resistance-like MFS transporter
MKRQYLIILMLLISFGSIGAVAFTPGLPMIAQFFAISNAKSELTVTWYLLGYTIGQLLYGPLLNRYGSKKTIGIMATIAAIGTIGCIQSHYTHSFGLLLLSRFIMAIGAGGGLTVSFAIASKLSAPKESAGVISLLTISFAITPGLGVFIGGILVNYYGWISPFYFMLVYSIIILFMSKMLPEVFAQKQLDALNPKKLFHNYINQFKRPVIFGGLLGGSGTCIIYTFAAVAPFIAIEIMKISPKTYGVYNFIPVIGMLSGSLLSRYLSNRYTPERIIKLGLFIGLVGVLLLFFSLTLFNHNALSLFAPAFLVYIGSSFIFSNSSALALREADDKSNASALMSFINMSSAVIMVMLLTFFPIHTPMILPLLYLGYIFLGTLWFLLL